MSRRNNIKPLLKAIMAAGLKPVSVTHDPSTGQVSVQVRDAPEQPQGADAGRMQDLTSLDTWMASHGSHDA